MIQWKWKIMTNQVAELDAAGKFLDFVGGYHHCWPRKGYKHHAYTQRKGFDLGMIGLRDQASD